MRGFVLRSGPCSRMRSVRALSWWMAVVVAGCAVAAPEDRGGTQALLSTAWTTFHPVAPSRLLDTRSGGLPDGDLVVTVPGPHVDAVLVNLTATDVTEGGYLSAHAGGSAPPPTSSLNVEPGATRANVAFVALSPENTFRIDRR